MIEFKNIDLTFENKSIFENFNLTVHEGEKILLKAPSGKGKSSLLKILLGFIKVDQGAILFDNKMLSKHSISYFRKNMSYISQDVDLRDKIVWNLIKEIFSYKANKHINITKDKVLDYLDFFDLEDDTINKPLTQLSGGERQRIGLIICILLDRKIWLLDEITSGLDKDLKKKVVDYVLTQEKTMLIISHDKIWTENGIVKIEEW